MQGVWASQYNERAMLSMRKVGIDFRDIRMAVLCQRVVPAAYAFVIHTTNPSNGAPSEPAMHWFLHVGGWERARLQFPSHQRKSHRDPGSALL